MAGIGVRNPFFHVAAVVTSKNIYLQGMIGFVMTMNRMSQNISNLVFRRNIPFKMETYVLNCEMLQVLAEMDGIKDVAGIAAALNKPLGDMMTIFAALYRQKLIFLIKPDPSGAKHPSPKLKKSLIESNPIESNKIDIRHSQKRIVKQQAGCRSVVQGNYLKKML